MYSAPCLGQRLPGTIVRPSTSACRGRSRSMTSAAPSSLKNAQSVSKITFSGSAWQRPASNPQISRMQIRKLSVYIEQSRKNVGNLENRAVFYLRDVVAVLPQRREHLDRKSTRLNSSHGYISYAVFCLKKT